MPEAFPDARALLKKHGLWAKKAWGQNFLVSERAYRAIVDAVVSSDADWVIEIGAGLGTLTARLAQRVPEGKVIAVERERDMLSVLEAELGHLEGVELVAADALDFDIAAIARWHGEPVAVCGNLPYNIASQILFRILEARAAISRAVVMIQKEMADRLLAAPGTKAYGALGVIVTTYADVRSVARVPPTAFVPPPKVESTVIRLDPLPAPRTEIADAGHYRQVVHAAFGQRRKTLRNALRSRFDPSIVDRALLAAGLDGTRRGETLEIPEFGALAAALRDA